MIDVSDAIQDQICRLSVWKFSASREVLLQPGATQLFHPGVVKSKANITKVWSRQEMNEFYFHKGLMH